MHVPYAFLAEAATVYPSGQFYLLGGNILSYSFPKMPAAVARLDLVVNVEVAPDEVGKQFVLQADCVDESGAVMAETVEGDLPFSVDWPAEFRDFPPSRLVVAHFPRLGFPKVGKYYFRVRIDGQEKRRIPLLVAMYLNTAKVDSPSTSSATDESPSLEG